MQLAPGAIDSAGNLFILYPEFVNQYPNYDGAAIKFVHAPQAGIVANPAGITGSATNVWSTPVTVAPSGGAGHLLPHIVAGARERSTSRTSRATRSRGEPRDDGELVPGRGQVAGRPGRLPHHRHPAGQLPRQPRPSAPRVLRVHGQPDDGRLRTGPIAGENGTICSRSTDVWGVTLDNQGGFQIAWPVAPTGTFGCSVCNDTFVTTQTDGPTIAPPPTGGEVPEAPWLLALLLVAATTVAAGLRRARRTAQA